MIGPRRDPRPVRESGGEMQGASAIDKLHIESNCKRPDVRPCSFSHSVCASQTTSKPDNSITILVVPEILVPPDQIAILPLTPPLLLHVCCIKTLRYSSSNTATSQPTSSFPTSGLSHHFQLPSVYSIEPALTQESCLKGHSYCWHSSPP